MTPTDYLFLTPAFAALAYAVNRYFYHRKRLRINKAFRKHVLNTMYGKFGV